MYVYKNIVWDIERHGGGEREHSPFRPENMWGNHEEDLDRHMVHSTVAASFSSHIEEEKPK